MTTFKNATPHEISIRTADGGRLTLPASDSPPRLSTRREEVASLRGVVFRKATLGAPEGLPPEVEGTILVVSALVAEHPDLSGRTDLAYPGAPLRDEAGRIVGCDGLCAGPGLARKLEE